jgi:hypothetical protein
MRLCVFVLALALAGADVRAAESADARRIALDEEVKLHRLLEPDGGGEIIASQSFAVVLPAPSAAYFLSTRITDEHGLPRVAFRVLDAEGATLQILTPADHWSSFEGVDAVAFRDMSGDGIPDVTVITSWTTGIGPEGVVPFRAAAIFVFEPDAGAFREAPQLLVGAQPLHLQTIPRIQAFVEATRGE